MSQQRQYYDTTYTKIFVGGLAWETQRDTMRSYFEQFGEILEAVVINDKNTGRSKGYGFVTFKEPEAALRACQNPSPVIDGRRANCNLAFFGAQKPKLQPPPQHVSGSVRSRPAPGSVTQHAYAGPSSTYFHQPSAQLAFPYSAYGYSGYSHDTVYPVNYYGVQQYFSPYYTAGATAAGGGGGGGTPSAAAAAGYFHNFYPYYSPYAAHQSSHSLSHHIHAPPHGYFGVQYPHMLQQQQQQQHYPFLHQQHYTSSGILSLPTSSSMPLPSTSTSTTTGANMTTLGPGANMTTLGPATGSGSGPSQASDQQKYSSTSPHNLHESEQHTKAS
ncbi:hypothetical protein Dimus_025402 [Dionaea muscipula]